MKLPEIRIESFGKAKINSLGICERYKWNK